MDNVKIVLHSAGIRELLKSAEIAAVCEAEAERMTAATGVPYQHDVYVGRTRVNAAGKTTDTSLKVHDSSKKRRSKKGSWITVDGQKRYIKGYYRKKRGSND